MTITTSIDHVLPNADTNVAVSQTDAVPHTDVVPQTHAADLAGAPTDSPTGGPTEVGHLLDALRRNEPGAWAEVTARYSGLLWSVAHSCRLSEHDAQDVVQTTWIRLLENLDRIREPERLAQWLATTARRESWRLSARSRKGPDLLGEEISQTLVATDAPVDDALLRTEQASRLRSAIATLPMNQQRLLAALTCAQAPSYLELSQNLGVPIGSLGPTRNRAVRKLRELLKETDSYN